MKKKNNNKTFLIGGVTVLLVIVFLGSFLANTYTLQTHHHLMGMDEQMSMFNTMRASMTGDLMHEGHYKCCLEKPCTYCLGKHGECDCLEDIMEGKHPCGECIGEIMEGHGNEFLAPYFATAIAEKVGERHLDSLKEMIFDMYDFPVEDQV